MRAAEHWNDFEVLDTSSGEKLERWGNVVLARPDPQIIWNTPKGDSWKKINARYLRSRSGGGSWEVRNMPAGSWTIGYRELTFKIQPTGFKHTGLFPEQAVNWDFMAEKIRAARKKDPDREIKVLNLFAYTGGATIACSAAGASVCHVDASKGMVAWARENAAVRPGGPPHPLDCGRLPEVYPPGDPPGQPVRRHHHGPALRWARPGR